MLLTCQTTGVEFQSTVFDPYDPSHDHRCENNTEVTLLPLELATEPMSTNSSSTFNGISTMITEFTPSSMIPILSSYIPMSPSSIPILSSSIPMSSISIPMSSISIPILSSSILMSPSSIPILSSSIPISSSSPMTITNTSTSTISTSTSTLMSTSSTSTSTTSLPMSTSSSSSSIITVEPTSSASIDLMCNDSTGVWPLTKAGSNVTISGVCYNGTVDGKK